MALHGRLESLQQASSAVSSVLEHPHDVTLFSSPSSPSSESAAERSTEWRDPVVRTGERPLGEKKPTPAPQALSCRARLLGGTATCPSGGCSANGNHGGARTAGAGESVPCWIQLIADSSRPSANIIDVVCLAVGLAVMQRTKDPVPD
jgi:hypothetical protein